MAIRAEKRVVEINADGTKAANTIKELSSLSRKLRSDLRNLDPRSKEFDQGAKQLAKYNQRLGDINGRLRNSTNAWKRFKTQVQTVIVGVLGASVVQAAFMRLDAVINGSIDAITKKADQISDIKKTTQLSAEGIANLEKQLGKIDTRKSRGQLRELAAIAGKLGNESVEDVAAFVRAANIIDVALGEDLGEDAVKNIGKLVNVFNLKQEFGLEKGMIKIASAINAIGASSEAGEQFQVEFLSRVGATARTVDIAAADILGYGAALDSLNQKVEASSTQLNKFFIDFVKDTDKFGQSVGLVNGELSKLAAEQGTNAAFIKLLETIKATSGSSKEFLDVLEKIGIDGTRGANTFLTLAQNIEMVKDQQELANAAFEDGTSVLDEYNEKNTNQAAVYEKALKKLRAFLKPIREFIGSTAVDFIKWLSENTRLLVGLIKVLTLGAVAWGAYRVATFLANKANIALLASLLKSNKLLALQKIAIHAAAVAQALFTGGLKKARVAMIAFNVATKLNPVGLLVGGITLAIGAFASFGGAIKKAVRSVFNLSSAHDELSGKLGEEQIQLRITEGRILRLNQGNEDRTKLIEQLKKQYPDYLGYLDSEKASNEEIKTALDKVNDSLVNKILLQKEDEKWIRNQEKRADVTRKIINSERELEERIVKLSEKYDVQIDQTKTLAQQAVELGKAIDNSRGPLLNPSYQVRGRLLRNLVFQQSELNGLNAIDNKLIAEKEDLLNRLGIKQNTETPTTTGGGETGGETEAERKAREKREEEARKTAAKSRAAAIKKQIDDTKKLYAQLKNLNIEAIEEEEAREIAKENLKYERRQKEIDGTKASAVAKNALLAAEEEAHQKRITAIEKKYLDERTKQGFEDGVKAIEEKHKKEILLISQQLAAGQITEEQYNKKRSDADAAHLSERKQLYIDYGKDITDIEQQITDRQLVENNKRQSNTDQALQNELLLQKRVAERKLDIAVEGSEAELAARLEILQIQMQQELELANLTEEEKALIKEQYRQLEDDAISDDNQQKIENALELSQQAGDVFFGILEARNLKEQKVLSKKHKADLKALDAKFANDLISEESYNAQRAELDEKYATEEKSLKKEAWKNQRKADLFTAFINTALAVTKALASAPPPINFGLAALVGALGGVQIAKIANQPEPEFRRGTVLKGPGHEQGGITLFGTGGRVYGEAEGDEIILTKNVYRSPVGRKLASDLNSSFGGVRFDSNATSVPNFTTPQFNLGGFVEAQRSTTTNRQTTPGNPIQYKESNASNTADAQIIAALQTIAINQKALADAMGLIPTEMKAFLVYDELEETVLDLRKARDNAQVSAFLSVLAPGVGVQLIRQDRQNGI